MDAPVETPSSASGAPPLAFVVAVWLGMPHDEILRGLAEGWIAAPPGSPPGWTPDWDGPDAPAATSDPHGSNDEVGRDLISDHGPDDAPSRATVQSWLRTLDPSLDDGTFAKLWTSSGNDDALRGGAWRAYLGRALGVPAGKSSGDAAAVDAAIAAAAADPSHRATIVSLAGRSGAQIAQLAATDAGFRYALANMDSVALTGNRALAVAMDPSGDLDRFDPNTGERRLSDAYIGDRAKLVAWKLHRDAGGDLAIAGDARWTFVDRARVDADGTPFTLTLEGELAGAATVSHRVVFGSADADAIAGGAAADRLYGGNGDDIVRGAGGVDRLEGGRGDDVLAGGRGDDSLAGGAGDDDVDGGSGDDALEGGSGDDTLAGGRGDDTLEGGIGDDVYAFDTGDGRDVIVDSDGRGRVVVDDVAFTGAGLRRDADGVWRGVGVEVRYSATADDPGMLSIRVANGTVDGGEVRIRDWRNGALGITLGDGTPPAEGPPAGADGTPPPDAQAPDIGDPPIVEADPPAADAPPDVSEARHPLDALWAEHDRAIDALSRALVDGASIASAARAFGAMPPDFPVVATDAAPATAVGVLGAAEIAAAHSFGSDDGLAALPLDAFAYRAAATTLAPSDASFAALADAVPRSRRS